MIYEPIIIPFDLKPFSEMNKNEAIRHFQWFVSEIPNRIKILQSYVYNSGNYELNLDYSVESLGFVWKWFLPYIKTIKISEEEMKIKSDKYPPWITDFLKNYRFSQSTVAMIIDIGIYFGEVFVNNNECKWGIVTKPKSYVYVNKPVIQGFGKDEMYPMVIVENLCHKVVRGEGNADSLYNTYMKWKQYIK